MTRIQLLAMLTGVVVTFGVTEAQQGTKQQPMTFAFDCAAGDCPLLKGKPRTSGMRGGAVSLKPGESVGWHSTSGNEEALVIVHGNGVASIEGHPDLVLTEKTLVYIPPSTRHNVTNTGSQVLEYVWIVAPTGR